METYKKALRSPIVDFVYGDSTPDIIGAVSGELFANKLFMTSLSSMSGVEASKELREYKDNFISIFKAAPREMRLSLGESIKNGIEATIQYSHLLLRDNIPARLRPPAIEQLDPRDPSFKQQVINILEKVEGNDAQTLKDQINKMQQCITTEKIFLKELQHSVDSALNEVGFSKRHGS